MREIIRFAVNRPVDVTLKRGGAKRIAGYYGPQMMYTLTDERVMYVPLIVAERIRELSISYGEMFQICKAEVRDGNRKGIEWQVSRVQALEQSTASTDAPDAGVSLETEAQGQASNSNGRSNGASRLQLAGDGALINDN
jgi:hypothetical protein